LFISLVFTRGLRSQIPSSRIVNYIPYLYGAYVLSWISSFIFAPATLKEEIDVKVETTEVTVTADNKVIVEEETEDIVLTPQVRVFSLQYVVYTKMTQKQAPHGTLATLFFTLPTPSLTLRSAALIINSLLLACAFDLVTQPVRDPATDVVFTRIGAVDPDGAKIMVRYPEIEGGAVRVLWRQTSLGASSLESAWKDGPLIPLSNATDWVGVGRIGGLWPSTGYECMKTGF